MKYLLVLFIASSLHAEPSKLTVRGSSSISAPPDQVSLSASVITEAAAAEASVAQNREKMASLFEALKRFAPTTSNFSLSPVYSQQPKNPPPDWRPVVTGFQTRNTIQITTPDLDSVGMLIDTLASFGISEISGLDFSIKDLQPLRLKALELAILQATLEAKTAAKAASVSLKRVLELHIEGNSPRPFMKAAAFATPIAPADVDITSAVNLTFELE